MMKLTRRRFALASGAVAVGFAAATPSAAFAGTAAASPVAVDPVSLVDPELRAALQPFLQRASANAPPEMSVKNLPAIRSRPIGEGTPLASPAYTERMIPGPKGAPDVRIFVINAAARGSKRPSLLHIHGGGYVAGKAADSIRTLQGIAATHNCVIVTVDYRLAPETPFPGSLEDNYASLRWLHTHADELGADRDRIAIMGESAGGGHAAALAIAARDRGKVPIVLQVLIYPMLDDCTGSSRKVPDHIGRYVWTAQTNRFGWSSLLGVPAGSTSVPAGAVPARVENLAGLPPAFIGVGSIDLFVQEDVAYAQRLIEAGVSTQLLVTPGAFHGFNLFAPQAAISKQFTSAWNDALRRALGARG